MLELKCRFCGYVNRWDDLSTLNHTQALISTSINAVCARTNSSEKYRVTELGYCGTTLLTSGNSVSMMILFTSVVDGRVILSPCWLSASLLIAHVTIVAAQHVVHNKDKNE
ncbi:hypothetical protein BLNAU_2640 [Blattamonas nauphoetae]|uniref:Uncharacterized protein n=1 Tax=Blattamonas nauphoetae TaxID=2049346 RepID=A0ABQ9WWG7_9EUKA|nr:hypothetical protein BLNAU_23335 [Blattamonas nauphoetae]KAK2942104.1 hypothetical protein BLNAU_22976 [Blattamonas nauphoetae]KAK2942787.1 hypothetical protein BLNAU_22305 [Blattamonas nauphoetae]KAK2943090.1 hypothetical protein BLNAU_21999 [Blattamonas nauphoetae]KAK2943846.1 hypothetical protein BLNAU_21237 [Blattamonas nauphoetae]